MKRCPKCNQADESGEIRFCESCGTELFFENRFKITDVIDSILTLYFSGTGNTKYIAELFSKKMDSTCHSIEADVNFSDIIARHNTVAFCYPIYGSRVPRIMREFVAKYMAEISGKKVIILVTQMIFSGDGARVFTDMFWDNAIEVIYAEHFYMPNNICNTPLLKKPGRKKLLRYMKKADTKMTRVCKNIKSRHVVKRGFSRFSQMLGNIQGKPWQGYSKDNFNSKPSMEQKVKNDVRIDKDCTVCNLCVKVCPMKNLENVSGTITQKNNCTVCYRCVNQCPHKAIKVFIHRKPKWQYKGV